MFMKKRKTEHLIAQLKVELEDPSSVQQSDLTILLEDSNFGQRWKDQIPAYDQVKNFRTHLMSLSCLSLKGFRRHSRRHVGHMVPEQESVKWLRGLLKSVCDIPRTKNSSAEDFYEMLRIIAFSDQQIYIEEVKGESTKERKTGKFLATQLLKINSNESPLITPYGAPRITKLTWDLRE